jgi:hypothetical protein
MIGRKMALVLLDKISTAAVCHLPEKEEEDSEENGQDPDTHSFGFLEHLYNAVHKGGNPEKPFEQGHQHESAHDGNVNNLQLSVLAQPSLAMGYLRPWSARDQ